MPPRLRNLVDEVRPTGKPSAAWESLYKDYINHSHQYGVPPKIIDSLDVLGAVLSSTGLEPESQPNDPVPDQGRREIYPNLIADAVRLLPESDE